MGNNILGWIVIGYAVLINFISLAAFAWDKRQSRLGLPRIAENKLILYAILGGSIGSILGMYTFHHKTRHIKFKWGLPVILLAQIILIIILFIPTK